MTADTPCRDVLSARCANRLAARSVETLGGAAALTPDEMLGWRGFGQTSLNEVVATLSRAGLRLAEPPAGPRDGFRRVDQFSKGSLRDVVDWDPDSGCTEYHPESGGAG